LRLSSDYLGLDYAEGMIRACREKFPGVVFVCREARDLTEFGVGAYAAVVFSFNGLDCVERGARGEILAGVHRLLRPGGYFLFSSHNYAWTSDHPFAPLPRYRHLEIRGDGWAVLNNPVYRSAFLTYYTTSAQQRRDLARIGFSEPVIVLDPTGREITPAQESDSPWLYYCVRK
jgi:SAM-dependent methyltransferase